MTTVTARPATAPVRELPGHRRYEARTARWMVVPVVALLALFLVLPFVSAFALSMTNARLISPTGPEFVGGANFSRLLTVKTVVLEPVTDPSGTPLTDDDGALVYPTTRDLVRGEEARADLSGLQELRTLDWVGDSRLLVLVGDAVFVRSLVNTVTFTLVIVPVQSALGLVLALLVNQRMRGVNAFRAMYFIPVIMSMVVVSILWEFLYDRENGMVNNVLGALTRGALGPVDWLGNPSTALGAVMVMSIWQAVGFHMVIWLAGLQNISGELYEAASLDGASTWEKFRYVTWPGLRHTRVFILITITIAAFGLFTQIDVMTQGGPLDSTTTVVYHAVQQGYRQQNMAYGSTISVVFFLMVLSVAVVQRILTREKD